MQTKVDNERLTIYNIGVSDYYGRRCNMEETLLHRKERLIITTIDIIHELGIQGLSTREIAKREGVSEATLFRHFKSKKDLLIAVLEYYSQFDEDIYLSGIQNKTSPKDAIHFLIKTYSEYYENYPAITSVSQIFDVLSYDSDLQQIITRIYNNRFNKLQILVEKAQANGEMIKHAGAHEITSIMIGLCRERVYQWRLQENSFSLKEKTLQSLEVLMEAFIPR